MQSDIITEQAEDKRVDIEAIRAANLFDAANYLLLNLKAPERVRRLFPALLGMLAGRKYKVTFTRLELGRRLFASHGGYLSEVESQRIQQRVTAYLSELRDWIHREGLEELITYEPGTKTETGSIRTPILQWIIELAQTVETRLHPDDNDRSRRITFRQESRRLMKAKGYRVREQRDDRPKRQPEDSTVFKTALKLLSNYYESKRANPQNDARQLKRFILSEIERKLDFLCSENVRESDDDRHAENTPHAMELRCSENPIDDSGTAGAGFTDHSFDEIKLSVNRDDCADMTDNVIPTEQPARLARDVYTAPAVPSSAQLAIDVFMSAGVTAFDESTIADGQRDYVRGIPGDRLRASIDERMKGVHSWGSSYMIRPQPPTNNVRLFQLDDVPELKLPALVDLALLIYETSPGKRQVWLAVDSVAFTGVTGEDYRLRVRRALISHYQADANASGSTRWPGSLNTKYNPPHVVTITHAHPGRVLRIADLPAVPSADVLPAISPKFGLTGSGTLPDYDRCLADAGGNANKADFVFALMALNPTRGCAESDVIDYLRLHSRKARNAALTVRNAARNVKGRY